MILMLSRLTIFGVVHEDHVADVVLGVVEEILTIVGTIISPEAHVLTVTCVNVTVTLF